MNLLWEAKSFPYVFMEGLYTTVGGFYDLLITIMENANGLSDMLSVVTKNLYLLFGIFMLFRLSISLIQMLIDPDKVNDKQEGAGKLLSRIVISIVLLFSFNYIVSFLNTIENIAIHGGLSKLIDNIFTFDYSNNKFFLMKKISNVIILNVDAESENYCFYIKMNHKYDSKERNHELSINSSSAVFRYSENSSAGEESKIPSNMDVLKQQDFKITDAKIIGKSYSGAIYQGNVSSDEYLFKFRYGNEIGNKLFTVTETNGQDFRLCPPISIDYQFIAPNANSSFWDSYRTGQTAISNSLSNIFKKAFSFNLTGSVFDMYNKYKQTTGTINQFNTITELDRIPEGNVFVGAGTPYQAIYYLAQLCQTEEMNYASSEARLKVWEGAKEDQYYQQKVCNYDNLTGIIFDKNGKDVTKEVFEQIMEEIEAGFAYKNKNSEGANAFARAVFGSFVNQGDANTIDIWFNANDGKFLNYDGSHLPENLAKLYEDGDFKFDFIMALICGIAVIVFLIILGIDLVVRGLKLLLLQVIAPIPIMCYMNPKDKIFNQWIKMYTSVYAELFIKLAGVQIAIKLIGFLMLSVDNTPGVFLKIIYLFGIFIFAKAVPDLLIKLFGLEKGSGSFKEAAGLAKAGLGFGVGAAAGAIGAGSVFAHGGTPGEALGVAGKYLKGGSKFDFSEASKAKKEGIKAGIERKAVGQTRRNAQKNAIKGHIPFVKTDQEVAQEKIAANDQLIADNNLKKAQSDRVNNIASSVDEILNKDNSVATANNLLEQYEKNGAVDKDVMSSQGYHQGSNGEWIEKMQNGQDRVMTKDDIRKAFKQNVKQKRNEALANAAKGNGSAQANEALSRMSPLGIDITKIANGSGYDEMDSMNIQAFHDKEAIRQANEALEMDNAKLKHDNYIK